MLVINNVSKNHISGKHSGVSNINLQINEGEIVSIVGESGSGKTTLLKLIYGLLEPEMGEISFLGKKVLGPSEKLIAGHDEMRMVTQEVTLNLYARVYDNISGQLSNTNLQLKEELTVKTMKLLRLTHLSDKKIIDLSGGEQQRVAIARAIITAPKVLLLDEPFSQVDTILKNQLRDDIERLAKELNITIIIVSHDPADALSLADKLVIIKDGSLVRVGEPKEVYNAPNNAYVAQLLGKANVVKNLDFLPLSKVNFAIYPHHIKLSLNKSAFKAVVSSIHFTGACNEVVLVYNETLLTVFDYQLLDINIGNEIWFDIIQVNTLSA